MVLKNRRRRILYLALAGMDVACLLPFVLTWIGRAQRWDDFPLPLAATDVLSRPIALFGICWIVMISYMVAIDLLNRRQVRSPAREAIIILMVLGTSIIGIRFLLYPIADFTSLVWLKDTALSVINFADGVIPPLLLILTNTFLWIRVAMASDRDVGFFGVGVSFRLGMLLSLLGGSLLSTIGGQSASTSLLYFTLFFAFGLVAVAVARIDEKAVGAASTTGTVVPFPRLAELGALILVIFGCSYALQPFLSPVAVRHGVAVLDPVWRLVGWALTYVLLAIFIIVGPLLERLMLTLERLVADAEPVQLAAELGPPMDFVGVEAIVREWTVLRYCVVIGAVVVVIAVLWFFFVQSDQKGQDEITDEDESEESSDALRPGLPRLDGLRNWLSMLRKYGVSRRLLNAITIENMYANLGRLARTRGYPRQPSQPPDDYLTSLQDAFPDEEMRLARITQAYMQVHYGDIPVEKDDLKILREDYVQIVEKPAHDLNN